MKKVTFLSVLVMMFLTIGFSRRFDSLQHQMVQVILV
jgi:hypothetical protein